MATLAPGTTGFRIEGAGTYAGGSGDFNGDGLPDIILNEGYFPTPLQPARAFVVFGSAVPSNLDVEDIPDTAAGVVISESETALNGVSAAATFVGDVNGDGRDDIAVGSWRVDYSVTTIVFGTSEPGRVVRDQVGGNTPNGFAIDGEVSTDQWPSNRIAAAGDLNGDGRGDLLLGAPRYNTACVVYGKNDGATVSMADLQQNTGGYCYAAPDDVEYLGESVAALGDLNGDALPDFVLGARVPVPPTEVATGVRSNRAYVVWGVPPPSQPTPPGVPLMGNGFVIRGAGYRVAAAGDLNADGIPDVLAATDALTNPNAVYAVFGKANTAAVETSDLDAELGGGFVVRGSPARGLRNDSTTLSIAPLGDVSADGRADFIFGDSLAAAANAYVVFGKATGDSILAPDLWAAPQLGFVIPGLSLGDETGAGVAGVGDLDGDGRGDIVVTSAGSETSYVIYSSTRFARP